MTLTGPSLSTTMMGDNCFPLTGTNASQSGNQTSLTAKTPPSNKGRRIVKINAFTQAKLIEALLDGVYTCVELAEMTGLHYVTVLQYTRELHRAKAAHICGWEKDTRGRDVIKIYKIGRGKDAKREKLTGAERQARTRTKKKAQTTAMIFGGLSRAKT